MDMLFQGQCGNFRTCHTQHDQQYRAHCRGPHAGTLRVPSATKGCLSRRSYVAECKCGSYEIASCFDREVAPVLVIDMVWKQRPFWWKLQPIRSTLRSQWKPELADLTLGVHLQIKGV